MHDTAEAIGGTFLSTYSQPGHVIVELGSLDVNGSIRSYAHSQAQYVGIDMEEGPGVDILATDEFAIPFYSGTADIVVASSVLEHAAFFWITILEMFRITKPGGLVYVSAPSNGGYHRYPTDNWRFYPDAGIMLERWGQRNGYPVYLMESFIAERRDDVWNDFVAVFQIGTSTNYRARLSDRFSCSNVWTSGASEPAHVRAATQDMILLQTARYREKGLRDELQVLSRQLSEAKRENAELRRQLRNGTSAEANLEIRQFPSPELEAQQRLIRLIEADGGNSQAAKSYLRELQGLRPLPEDNPKALPVTVLSGFGRQR